MDPGVRQACFAGSVVGLALLLILTLGLLTDGVELGFEQNTLPCPPLKLPLGVVPDRVVCASATYGGLTPLGWLVLTLGIVGFVVPLVALWLIGRHEGRPGPMAMIRRLLSN